MKKKDEGIRARENPAYVRRLQPQARLAFKN